MDTRHADGSAGDANYGRIGDGYSRYRQPEPRIAAMINAFLGDTCKVLNVGACAGSYEPWERQVSAIEPSSAMRAQRPAHLSIAIDAVAERIPFADQHFDGAMATFTVHQWSDLQAGLGEMRRVTRGPVVILTCDPDELDRFWLNAHAVPGYRRAMSDVPRRSRRGLECLDFHRLVATPMLRVRSTVTVAGHS